MNIWENVEAIADKKKFGYGWKKSLFEETGISTSMIHDWHKRGKIPRSDTLLKLASYLNCTTDEILRGTHPEPTHSDQHTQRAVDAMHDIDDTCGVADTIENIAQSRDQDRIISNFKQLSETHKKAYPK